MIREAPPRIPPPLEPKIVKLAAQKFSPPPRKLIIERPASSVVEKTQPIIIERWLAPKMSPRRVVFDGVAFKGHDPVRNEIHEYEYESPNLVIEKKFVNLGVSRMDPNEVL